MINKKISVIQVVQVCKEKLLLNKHNKTSRSTRKITWLCW